MKKNIQEYCEIIEAEDIIFDDESPLAGAKKSKNTSMWKTIDSLKEKNELPIFHDNLFYTPLIHEYGD